MDEAGKAIIMAPVPPARQHCWHREQDTTLVSRSIPLDIDRCCNCGGRRRWRYSHAKHGPFVPPHTVTVVVDGIDHDEGIVPHECRPPQE